MVSESPGVPKKLSGVLQGQNYLHCNTKTLFCLFTAVIMQMRWGANLLAPFTEPGRHTTLSHYTLFFKSPTHRRGKKKKQAQFHLRMPLNEAVKIVNFIKVLALSKYLFNILCDEMESISMVILRKST